MKKLSFLLLSLLAVTLFTACGNEDEPVNKQSFTSTINCRAIDGDQVVFSQSSAKVELNYTDMIAWRLYRLCNRHDVVHHQRRLE